MTTPGPIALTLGEARTLATVVVIVLVVLAIGAAWVMKTVAQKIALVVILGLLALLVWTQRISLQDCADQVRAAGLGGETDCSFFGRDVTVRADRP